MKLSHAAKQTIELARNGSLGRKFPTLEKIMEDTQGDLKEAAKLLSKHYSRYIGEASLRAYGKLYGLN